MPNHDLAKWQEDCEERLRRMNEECEAVRAAIGKFAEADERAPKVCGRCGICPVDSDAEEAGLCTACREDAIELDRMCNPELVWLSEEGEEPSE